MSKKKGSAFKTPEDLSKLKEQNAPSARERRRRYAGAAESDRGRASTKKRRKFRGGNYVLYYIMGIIVAAVLLVILSNTVLFNVSNIYVSGNSKYTADEVIASSQLEKGENLLHINALTAQESIVNALAYIDDAQVKKSFPTSINITVTEAEKIYCIEESGTTAIISKKGKILEHAAAGDLPIVRGYEPETLEIGKWLTSKTEGKSEIPETIFTAADKAALKNITSIDMTDKFNVKVTVEDRVILVLGSVEEIESKLLVAVEIIENQLGQDEYVTILLTNPEKVPVQNNSAPQSSKRALSTQNTQIASSSATVSVADPEPTVEEPTPDPEPTPAKLNPPINLVTPI